MAAVVGSLFVSRTVLAGGSSGSPEKKGQGTKRQIKINDEFWEELGKLIKIIIPGVRTKEFGLLALHTSFLISRTILSIKVAELDGSLVKTIVDNKPREFIRHLLKWLALAVPATFVNSMIRYLEKKFSLALRTRLVTHLYDTYMDNETYYRIENLDSRIRNADQSLTKDVASFCDHLAHIHSQISKPLLDVFLMSIQLMILGAQSNKKAGGSNAWSVPGSIGLGIATVTATYKLLKFIAPPFGKMAAEEAQLEGELRAAHSALITNSEEIAFYHGHDTEKRFLWRSYVALTDHVNSIYKSRIWYNMCEGFLMKYVWSSCGLLMLAVPTFTRGKFVDGKYVSDETVSERTEGFVTARSLLLSLSDASERVMSSYKEITELAGYTHRVSQMIQVFEDVRNGKYQKQLAATASTELMASRGKVEDGDFIEFNQVPIISPNGDVLIESLNFKLTTGMHTLVSGPNGCGKSSLFRILAGLWPVHRGELTKPSRGNLFYIPQRAYLSHGNLREQVIYPDTEELMRSKGHTDDFLVQIMEWVDLNSIVQREANGWDAVNEWSDVLSGGEKQRLAMARLFYHCPKFAILDECTSQVSEDVEGKVYMKAKELGITLLTVTHRHTLWKYHNHLLQMDGRGGWKYSELDASTRMSLKEEKSAIEFELIGIPSRKERLMELCVMLGETSKVLKDLEEGTA
eukprot:TRINITY_DN11404_c0_g1_i1.p1 TRINITY_DN11404_c0_g1~~TRINITY_DN11404_c0_g1_i1.p1  ORF type:complete len:716 (+),score=133.26 TRINITY_DN11404_c0_g1_i1:82-2148(+)